MNKTEERLEQLEEELTIVRLQNKDQALQIAELLTWKKNCNIVMAWWGGVLMAVFTAGGIIVRYYENIKSYLQALWAVK